MLWYVNDASLQGQFVDRSEFEQVLRKLLAVRARYPVVRSNLRSSRCLPEALIAPELSMRRALSTMGDKELKSATFSWLDRNGPFVEDDILHEIDDYFEYATVDVTTTGLGEAARRTKGGIECATYSFIGGNTDYAVKPLRVDHGLPEERYGQYDVDNLWHSDDLIEQASTVEAPSLSWVTMFETARRRFPNLEIGPLEKDPRLAREPFEASLRDRCMELMQILNDYVSGRNDDGSEGARAREILSNFFTGDRALFSGESASNQRRFSGEMTFQRSAGGQFFAHWHGKISHRYFRLHFEWPLEKDRKKLEIFYLGPKLTKS